MAARLSPGPGFRRLSAGACVVSGVVVAHGCVVDRFEEHLADAQAALTAPTRMTVSYVREMTPSAPTAQALPVRKAAPRRTTSPPVPTAKAASAVDASEAAALAAQVAQSAQNTAGQASDAVGAAASASAVETAAPAAFEWPVSTRLRYRLTGYVQGEVHGQAQVEWLRNANRYQVHLDVSVGPSIAPLVSRRLSSDGEITPEGLSPQVYDQETRIAFSRPNRALIRFEPEHVTLANGRNVTRPAGTQDTASQFVQMSWMFAMKPDSLKVGHSVEIPLAMPRNLSPWIYDVSAEETLQTPFGELLTFHLKPRRQAQAGGDLTSELWIAPQLRYLPVRFIIRQDAENFIDLMLDRKPELADK